MWGANKAANAQKDATRAAIDAQTGMYNRTLDLAQGYLDPFVTTGKSALTSLAQLYGLTPPDGSAAGQPFSPNSLDAFTRSPDYAFARDQGIDALTRSAAGSGMLHSGNYLRDLTTFGSGLATQSFGNYANRLTSLAGMGQNAATSLTSTVAGLGTNTGNSLAGLNMAMGNADASGYVGMTNALNGGLSGLTNNLLFYNMMNKGSGYGSSPMSLSPGNYGGTGGSLGGFY